MKQVNNMSDLIISDSHIGNPRFDSDGFIDILTRPEFNRIILNGDIFDIWEDDFDDIVKNNLGVVTTIQEISINKVVVYIIGNHDPSPEKIKIIFPNIIIADEFKIDNGIIFHGHQYDDNILKYSWFGKILFYFNWILSRIGLDLRTILADCWRKLLSSIANKKDKEYYEDLVLDVEQSIVDDYKNMFKFVIVGHTHWQKITTIDNFIYANCGDWIGHRQYATYTQGKISLSRY